MCNLTFEVTCPRGQAMQARHAAQYFDKSVDMPFHQHQELNLGKAFS